MKQVSNIQLFASPESIRIFWGYKLEKVTQEQFNKDLGETFMPGTPAVLGPMGLNGYLPAVLDLRNSSRFPDEVALIVYPSLSLYEEARRDNLLGRIYTFSHAGVFDMAKSGGQWPGTTDSPIKHAVIERWSWRVFDTPLDWQRGQSRLVVISSVTTDLFEMLLTFSNTAKATLQAAGVEEIIIQCTRDFATIWFYSTISDLKFDLNDLKLTRNDVNISNDLFSEPVYLRRGNEAAMINGPKYFQFIFPRENRFYI